MAVAATSLASMIARYARELHDVVGTRHHVASPLGAWLLLALCGPATEGANRTALTKALGCDADAAADIAASLLAAPHPLVAAAAAVWNAPGRGDQRWLASLPPSVQRGDIPSQDEADSWARQHTFGLIDRFPVRIDESLYLLLATALATKVSWDCPFELAPGSALGPSSPWRKRLARVLESPRHPSHTAFIATTAEAGDVAVHIGEARDGLLVASVIAAADVPAGDVLAAAHRLATAHALGRPVERRSLFDLALGDGPAWSVREESSLDGPGERCTAFLPAWSAQSSHDLADPRLGFAAAADALGHPDPWQATQAAMASYSRIGFEAGAVTALAVRMSMRLPQRGRLRTADLRFGHPFAVVAVAADDTGAGRQGRRGAGSGPWNGVPVFSAWVTEPAEADEDGRCA